MNIINIRKAFLVGFVSCGFAAATAVLSSCENGDVEFGDYDYQTVYFSHQTPIRVIVLGDDIFDRTLDNNHQFEVYATLGGVESNKRDRNVSVTVDASLCAGMEYSTGGDVLALPESYYSLSSNNITILKGNVIGAVTVQLTDAFFNDPKAISLNYVLPLRITSSEDSILESKDYTLYGLKYINKYDGAWLCHGTDIIDENGLTTTTVKRDTDYVEDYDVRTLSTLSLNSVGYQVSDSCHLILTFDGQDNCTVTTDSENCDVEGTGIWIRGGAEKAWGGKDRDLLKLSYTITYHYSNGGISAYTKYTTTEELIMRDRQVNKLQEFSVQARQQ